MEYPLLAQMRSDDGLRNCLLIGVDRKSSAAVEPTRLTQMYGPAVRCKRFSSSWHSAVLHQCIRSLLGAVLLRTIMDISARAISLADRPQRAIWVTSVRMRREDRSSISSFPLADLGGKGFVITLSLVLAMFSVIRLRMSDRAPERSRRCGRACWRVRSPAHCDAAACWPPRSALARGAPRFSV